MDVEWAPDLARLMAIRAGVSVTDKRRGKTRFKHLLPNQYHTYRYT